MYRVRCEILLEKTIMTSQEKTKGKPRRRLYLWLMILLLFIVSGFFVAPYAEERLITWLDDDPFTPMCDAGNLELAFIREQNEVFQAYTLRLDGSKPQLVSDSENVSVLEWSPDGQSLGLMTHTDNGYDFDVIQNNEPLNLGYIPSEYFPNWRWSYDSQYVVLFHSYGNGIQRPIEVFPVEYSSSGITITTIEVATRPDWSPIDNRVIFRDGNKLVMASLEGQSYTLRTLREDVTQNYPNASWSPDGRYIGYLNEDEFHFITVHDDSFDDSDLPYIWAVDGYQWSPDGRYIAFRRAAGTTNAFGLVVLEVETRDKMLDRTGLILDDWSEQGLLTSNWFNRDGVRGVEVRMFDNEEFRSTEPIFIYEGSTGLPFSNWTPDNNAIVYRRQGDAGDDDLYYLVPLQDSTNPLTLSADNINLYGKRGGGTPDKRYLTYEGTNNWLYLLDLETYESCRVVEGNADGITRYDWRIIPS
jgi:WD40 repeat protein